MSRIRTLGIAALALALALMVTTTQAAEKGKKKGHAVRGVVTNIDTAKNTFTVTIHKKGGDEETKVFTVDEKTTTFVKGVRKQKGQAAADAQPETPLKFTDLKEKAVVTVEATADGKATKVSIYAPRKPKKPAA